MSEIHLENESFDLDVIKNCKIKLNEILKSIESTPAINSFIVDTNWASCYGNNGSIIITSVNGESVNTIFFDEKIND